MFSRFLPLLAAALLALTACTQTDTSDYTAPERGDPEYLKGKNTRVDQLYVSTEVEPGGRDFRNVYIAPADLSKLLIIQPEGVKADEGWQVSDIENSHLQQAIVKEFTATLGFESAYNVVPRGSRRRSSCKPPWWRYTPTPPAPRLRRAPGRAVPSPPVSP